MPALLKSKELTKLRTSEEISRMAVRMTHCKNEADGMKGVRSDCLFKPNQFGPLWLPSAAHDVDVLFAPPEDVNNPEICWPMSIGYAHKELSREHDDIKFNYWHSIPAKNLRGVTRFTGRKNIAWYHGRLDKNGKFLSTVMYAAWDGRKWRTAPLMRYDTAFFNAVKDTNIGIMKRHIDKGEEDIGIQAALGQSIALTFRYEWGAQFSFPGSPKIIVPTTPRGILELFNDREKTEGRDRRSALKHWVGEHVRQSSAGRFHHVIDHLRGQLKFSWRGWDVEIKPAKFDLEKIETSRK